MRYAATTLILAASVLIAGCSATETKRTAGTDVFGVVLGEKTDHRTLGGVKAEREPCLRGYEYVYESIALRIGYRPDGAVRAITTRNAANTVAGVKTGDTRAEADAKLRSLGFIRETKADSYANPPMRLTLLVGEDQKVFGIRLELAE